MEEPTAASPEPERELMNPVPFVVALVLVVIVAALAIVFLRDDSGERVVRPDGLRRVNEATIEAIASGQSTCIEPVRAQVDVTDTQIFVELVVHDVDGPCTGDTAPLRAQIDLPEAVGDRRLLAGAGRTQLPCRAEGSGFRCGPGR